MLISPPFLHPDRAGATHPDDDAKFIDDAMPNVLAYHGLSGNFPISHQLGWHGGRHIGANLGGAVVPVRAIADGVLCYRREPTQQPDEDDHEALEHHPLNYRGLWTDDGVVVLKHTTEIGEGVSVTFYSLYAHLRELKLTAQPGDRVYRKDILGRAGAITGQINRIHLEILADEDNLQRLMPGPFTAYDPSQAHGRSSCVWGEIYFHVPAGQPVYRRNPREIEAQDYTIRTTDTLEDIARRFGTHIDVLARLNHATHQRYRPDMSYEQWFDYQRGYVDTLYAGPHLRIMQVPQHYDTTVSATEDKGPNPVLHP